MLPAMGREQLAGAAAPYMLPSEPELLI
jgi:hypothetical protein